MGNKDIKDYLHLYLGCEFEYKSFGRKYIDTIRSVGSWVNLSIHFEEVKPILRPLSDMTEEEQFKIQSDLLTEPLGRGRGLSDALKNERLRYVMEVGRSFELTNYLLKQGFDLFGLIKAGLAIDKTKIEHNGK